MKPFSPHCANDNNSSNCKHDENDENNNGEFPILAIELHSMPIIILSTIICSAVQCKVQTAADVTQPTYVCLKIHQQQHNQVKYFASRLQSKLHITPRSHLIILHFIGLSFVENHDDMTKAVLLCTLSIFNS